MRNAYLALAVIVMSCPVSAETIHLARDGKPVAAIVVAPDAGDLPKGAAADLQHYVQAICGVELPVREDGAAVDGGAIYIGQCAPSVDGDLPPEGTNPETYAIRVRDNCVFLTGRHEHAVSFAVVSFIEDVLGVRWFAPGDLWEYVPAGTPGTLDVEVAERVVAPDWSCRVWSGHAWTDSWKAWNRRNKAICVSPVPFRNMQNFLHTVFAPEKYAESHPEYYPLIDGKRWIPPEGERAWRPCESNPDVVRITVEAAREYLDAHPEHNGFSLAMDDIYRLCGCEKCRALDARPDDYKRRRFSDRHYKFVNAVARELAKTHPDKYVGTLCYAIARELPETVPELEPNVFISMTQCCAEWWRPGRKEEDMELTRQWRERCSHMSRYDYLGLGFITPRTYPHAMAEGMKFDHALGFEAVYNECYTFLPNTAPMMWMVARLQWDTDLDADALLDEFYARMFGSAAPQMKQYYEVLERSWMTPRPNRAGWGHRRLMTQAGAMAPEDIDRAEGLLGSAQANTTDPSVLRRIDIVGAGLRYGAYPIRANALRAELADMRLDKPRHAGRALTALDELARLSVERQEYWAAALERDDLLGETLRGLRGRKYFVVNQISGIETPGPLLTALDVLDTKSPAAASDWATRFAAVGGPFGDLAQAWLGSRTKESANLLQNGEFEQIGPNRTESEKDWDTAHAPPGWHTWSRPGRDTQFALVARKGRSRSTAASITEADSASYLQTLAVEPGQRYLCSVWFRPERQRNAPSGRLEVRWQTESGEWFADKSLEPATEALGKAGQWQPLALVATVPKGAAKLVFILSTAYQQPGAAALFDDASLHLVSTE
ncbi:MAG: DUF4838 domain-containing protein [Candidatus Hydrogenedentes bacterium]|nr:DUF4838 domain-containing protein [Candidatus Hydrogenedentota bacterium]